MRTLVSMVALVCFVAMPLAAFANLESKTAPQGSFFTQPEKDGAEYPVYIDVKGKKFKLSIILNKETNEVTFNYFDVDKNETVTISSDDMKVAKMFYKKDGKHLVMQTPPQGHKVAKDDKHSVTLAHWWGWGGCFWPRFTYWNSWNWCAPGFYNPCFYSYRWVYRWSWCW